MLGVVGAVTQAAAAPILYDISFSVSSIAVSDPLRTPGPPVGSFKYDSTAANPFSDFFVVWNSITFDFTAEANTASPNPIDRFNALNGACGNRAWTAVTTDPLNSFEFKVSAPGIMSLADDFNKASRIDVLANGTFSITASEVPEPSTYALLLSGGALMLATGRRIRRGQEKSNER
jgi:hypothetical protein